MNAFSWRSLFVAATLVPVAPALSAYDPAPWIADLAQIQAALRTDYANLEWLEAQSPVDARFARAKSRIELADSDATARRAIERLLERFHDGHVEIEWPTPTAGKSLNAAPAAQTAKPIAQTMCQDLGHTTSKRSTGTVSKLPGYTALPGGPIPAGTVQAGNVKVGTMTLGVFMPQGYPEVCERVIAALKLPPGKPCDDKCADAILTRSYADLTAAVLKRIVELRAAGSTVLLVDVSGNGGGSEWVEAVARMLTAKALKPAPWAVVRTSAWVKQWTMTAETLTKAAASARGDQQSILNGGAAYARAFAVESARDCGQGKGCDRLAAGGHATGILAAAPTAHIDDEAAAVALWSPSQFMAPVGAWQGPLIVLTDGETWSAAEELAATLQDNRAAAILGERTGGAGCGHASGAHPITLNNSGGRLTLPDCARFRFDGSNEVAGVIPAVLTGHRPDDNDTLKAKLIAAKLPEAVALAQSLVGN